MNYQLVFLLKKKEEEEIIKKIVENFAKIIKTETWGEKTLAYPIKKNHKAYYFNYIIEIDPKKTLELKRKLNFEEKLLRYLLLVNS